MAKITKEEAWVAINRVILYLRQHKLDDGDALAIEELIQER